MTDLADPRRLAEEHRLCGTPNGYDGCYSHWPMEHCRADGMLWPCDVDRLRPLLDRIAELEQVLGPLIEFCEDHAIGHRQEPPVVQARAALEASHGPR